MTDSSYGSMLTPLGESKRILNSTGKKYNWYDKYICKCGKEKWIRRGEVERGATKSCGCTSRKSIKHGDYLSRFYGIFIGLKVRCNNKKSKSYKLYGGRGIKCLWTSYEDFKNDMFDSYQRHVKLFGEKDTTIDRIDSDGDYCKKNCRRATYKQQGNNRRNTRYDLYGISSEMLSAETGLSKHALQGILHRNHGDFYAFIKRLEKRFNKNFILKQINYDIDMSKMEF